MPRLRAEVHVGLGRLMLVSRKSRERHVQTLAAWHLAALYAFCLTRPAVASIPRNPLRAVEGPNVVGGVRQRGRCSHIMCVLPVRGSAHSCAISEAAGQSRLTMVRCI